MHELHCWLRSLQAPTVTHACNHLANLTNIPECVSSNILLRSPLSKEEVALQLDLWETFIEPIAKAYHRKPSHPSSIIQNLAYYTVHLSPNRLPELVRSSVDFLTSTKYGFKFSVMTPHFANKLIYSMALNLIQNSSNSTSAVHVIKAQEHLVKFLTHQGLSQRGYVGIVLAIVHESEDNAFKLFKISQAHYPDHTQEYHLACIYLSTTPEQLLHNFNKAVVQYPASATFWYFLAKKLLQFELLTEVRAFKLLEKLVNRRKDLLISKDTVLTLLRPIESVNGIEAAITLLEDAEMLPSYRDIVHRKYMSLLYRYSMEKNVRKPYLDKVIKRSSNLECARHLYSLTEHKRTSSVGAMLSGEVYHQPQNIYNLYKRELEGRVPDESCLSALLRASVAQPLGRVMVWGQLFAPQVAVHEFKKHVSLQVDDDGLVPSARLWTWYVKVLICSGYMAELADIIRWWELVQFVPPKGLLLLLLRLLPSEFVLRHLKHVSLMPKNSTHVSRWPWPSAEELSEAKQT